MITFAVALRLQVDNLDAVVIPVGGGGLIAGMALAIKSIRYNNCSPSTDDTMAATKLLLLLVAEVVVRMRMRTAAMTMTMEITMMWMMMRTRVKRRVMMMMTMLVVVGTTTAKTAVLRLRLVLIRRRWRRSTATNWRKAVYCFQRGITQASWQRHR